MPQVRQILVFAGFALATACGGGNGSGLPPKTVAAFSGAPQTDTVLATLLNPLVALVRENADPLPGVTVTWTAAGNGKVNGAATATTTTGADGKASVTYQLGSTAGTQTPTAAATGVSGSASFALTATAGAAVDINKSATVDTASTVRTSVPYTVLGVDSYGNPRAGVVIDWLATGGGGSIAPPQNTTVLSGTASATRTLSGNEGDHTATATASGLTGAPSETFTTVVVTLPSTADVAVNNNTFSPRNAKVAVGAVVTWTWAGVVGGLGHNVTFGGGTGAPTNCGTSSDAGHQCAKTFSTAGTFDYECTNHPGMSGTIAVR